MIVVAILGILAVVAVPAFIKYMRRAKTVEAVDMLNKIYKGAAFYYSNPKVGLDGVKHPCQFPQAQSITPNASSCCDDSVDSNGDERCDSDSNIWNTDTWAALTFEMRDEHYFIYAYDSEGVRAEAIMTASAYGDLDCDDVTSTFQILGLGDPQAGDIECSIRGAAGLYSENETE
tara:strand:+ start:5741 stop:6265 length:525 start_codon:yes stop_codon:yes gene_type:complete